MAETKDADLEVIAPEQAESASRHALEDMDMARLIKFADEAPKRVAAYKEIFKAILGIALPGDWMKFGQAGKEYIELGSAGAERLKRPFGVKFPPERVIVKRERGTDAIGEWFRYEAQCVGIFNGTEQLGIGFAGSRDKFYGFAHEEWKPIEEVRETDIHMAAVRSAQKEAIKQLFGLRRIPLEDAVHLGLPANVVRGHQFPSSGTDAGRPAAGAASKPGTRMAPPSDVEHQTAHGMIKEIQSPPKSKRTFLVLGDDSKYAQFSDRREIWMQAGELYNKGVEVSVDYTVNPQWGNTILRVQQREHRTSNAERPTSKMESSQPSIDDPKARGMLLDQLRKVTFVKHNGSDRFLEQWLIDEAIISDTETLAELTAVRIGEAIAAATKKLGK